MGKISYHEVNLDYRFKNFSSNNPYTIYNIKHYIKLNNINCKLLSTKYINNTEKLKFKCSCGNIFYVGWNDFLHRINYTCEKCSAANSSLERKTIEFLTERNIDFKKEYCLKNPETQNNLRIDFAIFDNDKILFIECDGIGHYEPVKYWNGKEGFDKQKQRDGYKDNYCEQNNIPLLRIPYWEFETDNYKNIIEEFLNQNTKGNIRKLVV